MTATVRGACTIRPGVLALTPEQRADYEARAFALWDEGTPKAEAERLALLQVLRASGISRVQE